MSTQIPRRSIGDLEVSALGLGCMGMSFAYGEADRDEALATLNRALDLGVNLLDTADMYGNGHNEQLLAEVLRTRRDEVVLATKFGILTDPETSMPNGQVDGSAAYARKAVDASLSRLGVDQIDLYYLHRPDPQVPIEESVGAMAQMVDAGKVRQIGLSEASAETLRRANAVHQIAAVQTEWSIFSRDIERAVVPTARELGTTVVAYSPLGRGLLTGSAAAAKPGDDDFRSTLPRWQGDNLDKNVALVERIREIADGVDSTPGQVALAWLLAQGEDVVPIPGTKRRKYLEENVKAATLVVPQSALDELSALEPAGDRTPDMSWVERDTVAAG
ncbi:aldo/keto reductase [Luteipulveratus mongoliensis]|uniref:Aldo/keto reductase n=1 Tax=Luteipulveratus mongoliensis TaxID=571913 RepID=A0A0K1JPJ2_9MICO|nr:aldo/keto reductase [Luteipulveratus mongoliensis]AKU14628.1 aldo/keto reductase [Luteipulveratus mongoliensis]AKU18485.1 aldo/keto reductase [Luteipulveratus mongoliensis]